MRFTFSGARLAATVAIGLLVGISVGAITVPASRVVTYCGLHWGDVATWVSAVATVGATGTALFIALWTPIKQRADAAAMAEERAIKVAMTLSITLTMMRIEIKGIPAKIETIRERVVVGGETSIAAKLILHGAERIPAGKDLEGLPTYFSAVLAALTAALYAHNSFVERFASNHQERAERIAFIEGIHRLVAGVDRMVEKAVGASDRYLES